MPSVVLRLAPLLLTLTFSGCHDLPTGPLPDPSDVGGLLSGECTKQTDGTYLCPPISSDPGTGSEPCMESTGGEDPESMIVQSCPPSGGPGDGSTGPAPGDGSTGGDTPIHGGDGRSTQPPPRDPPPTEVVDTCDTGDAAFDDPIIMQGLKDLWTRSNPVAPQAQRLEQAAWIIHDAGGSFRMAPFITTRQGPCNVNGNFNPPAGAVAWVHTHPFWSGEVQTVCGALKQPDPYVPGGFRDVLGPDGQPVYPEYRNSPSIPDRELLNDINATMEMLGRNPLAGVIIDANQITVYSENSSDGTAVFPRCSY